MSKENLVLRDLICPKCKSTLDSVDLSSKKAVCIKCEVIFPIVDYIPILIDESQSIFSFTDFIGRRNLYFDISGSGRIRSIISKILPNLGGNNLGKRNFSMLEELLLADCSDRPPRILVIGGSIIGDGMNEFLKSSKLEIIEADVSFGPQTKIVFDAHSIPYADSSFDCVIVQAVLEHVIDSYKCVNEICRVLKTKGIVYAETPFMQQVHGGPYDFVRFTRSGHRWLFQRFEELKSGSTAGSGTALAWSYEYFLLSLFGYTKLLSLCVKVFARITGFWIKYFDNITQFNLRDADGSSGFYFMGRKSDERTMTCKDLIDYYR